jgi:hypothetical protein
MTQVQALVSVLKPVLISFKTSNTRGTTGRVLACTKATAQTQRKSHQERGGARERDAGTGRFRF